MDRILITAFEPFGSASRNASAEVLRLLPDKIGGTAVRKMLLPVVFGKAAEAVLSRKADAVFLLGEAGGRTMVTPEKKAENLRNARIPDNEGNQPKGEKILPDGPEELHARIPVDRLVQQMQDEGYSVSVSEDAGAFVCNDTFYLVASGSPVPVEFIHCPARPENAADYAPVVERFIALALSEIRLINEAAR